MQLHKLKPISKKKRTKRVGRGGKRGTYSGRGIKGQKARSGRRLKPIIRELIKRYPKRRGYKFKGWKIKPVIVNISLLEERFKTAQVVSPKSLLEKKIIHRIKGKVPKVKILGKGEITKKLTIEGCDISKNAKDKIEQAGGRVK